MLVILCYAAFYDALDSLATNATSLIQGMRMSEISAHQDTNLNNEQRLRRKFCLRMLIILLDGITHTGVISRSISRSNLSTALWREEKHYDSTLRTAALPCFNLLKPRALSVGKS
jgi:hypothetical protein